MASKSQSKNKDKRELQSGAPRTGSEEPKSASEQKEATEEKTKRSKKRVAMRDWGNPMNESATSANQGKGI